MLNIWNKFYLYDQEITDGWNIIEYDGKVDGSQLNWLSHNQICATKYRYQIDLGNPGHDIGLPIGVMVTTIAIAECEFF